MKLERREIFAAIERERTYQDGKYPGPYDTATYLLVLEAELQEAKMAWIKGTDSGAALMEVLQIAAVAVACIEHHGLWER